jgi:phosphoribosylaminoimidazole-succinocarboxamide synthase
MIVRKTKPLPVECAVRGYLAGSGWKEYQQTGTTSGLPLPKGLELASKLPEPIFAPSTKSEAGHDENIDWEKCCAAVGRDVAERVRDVSLKIYEAGRAHAANCGIIVADTKFEFGLLGDELLLIDECLTPDSSRFWPADQYVVGQSPPSFDKQFVRDYLKRWIGTRRRRPFLAVEIIESHRNIAKPSTADGAPVILIPQRERDPKYFASVRDGGTKGDSEILRLRSG